MGSLPARYKPRDDLRGHKPGIDVEKVDVARSGRLDNFGTLLPNSAFPCKFMVYRKTEHGKGIAGSAMGGIVLKISVHDSQKLRRLVLEGKAMEPWIEELGAAWSAASSELRGRRLEVDVRNVTAVSEKGESALMELMKRGARFRCSGVLMKHIVRELLQRISKESDPLQFPCRQAPFPTENHPEQDV